MDVVFCTECNNGFSNRRYLEKIGVKDFYEVSHFEGAEGTTIQYVSPITPEQIQKLDKLQENFDGIAYTDSEQALMRLYPRPFLEVMMNATAQGDEETVAALEAMSQDATQNFQKMNTLRSTLEEAYKAR